MTKIRRHDDIKTVVTVVYRVHGEVRVQALAGVFILCDFPLIHVVSLSTQLFKNDECYFNLGTTNALQWPHGAENRVSSDEPTDPDWSTFK